MYTLIICVLQARRQLSNGFYIIEIYLVNDNAQVRMFTQKNSFSCHTHCSPQISIQFRYYGSDVNKTVSRGLAVINVADSVSGIFMIIQ